MNNPTPLTPLHFLARGNSFFGHHPAVVSNHGTVSYCGLHSRVCRIAASLVGLGITPGEKVVVITNNCLEMLELHYAIPAAHGVVTALNPYLDNQTLIRQLKACHAKVLIIDPGLFDPQLLGQLTVSHVYATNTAAGVSDTFLPYETLLDTAGAESLLPDPLDEFETISQFYTSGTTGDPKPVSHSHRSAYIAALSNALSFRLEPTTVMLWTWPMFHSNGLSFIWAVTAVAGTHVCIPSTTPADIVNALNKFNISVFCCPPSTLGELVAYGGKLSGNVTCITGGAPLPRSIVEQANTRGIRVIHQYGASEAFGPATINWDGFIDQNEGQPSDPTWQGKPTPAIQQLNIVDPDLGTPVPRDGTSLGEIRLRGSTLMQDDWLNTGDLGSWHEDGSIEVKDRVNDAIRTEQGYVSSIEIENVIYQHPTVQAAAVVAIENPAGVFQPCAFVELAEDTDKTSWDESIIEFCEKRLPRHQVPCKVYFESLPTTATGKVQKRLLRARARVLAAN